MTEHVDLAPSLRVRSTKRTLGPNSPLTAYEWDGLELPYNLADGHAQGTPSREFSEKIVGKLSDFADRAIYASQTELEKQALSKLASLWGQQFGLLFPEFYYSSSVAIEVAAKYLAATDRKRVGVVCPAFDNIPALLRRHGLELEPVSEDEAYSGNLPPGLSAIVLIVPNNPTGVSINEDGFASVLRACQSRNIALIVDFSFRHYEPDLRTWCQYSMAQQVAQEIPVIFIEDTGKVYPLLELKVGVLFCNAVARQLIAELTDEVLLNVSPLALAAIAEAANLDIARRNRGDATVAEEVVNGNRKALRSALAATGLSVARPASKTSVELLNLPAGRSARQFVGDVRRQGVAVLPGDGFFWAGERGGCDVIRVALYRSPTYFREAVRRLVAASGSDPDA